MNSPPPGGARAAPWLREALATIALVLLALGVTLVVLQRIDRRESDATIDWMLVHTAAAGGDVSVDVAQTAEETGRIGVWAAWIWLGIASLSLVVSGIVGSVGVIPYLIVLPVILLVAVLASPSQFWHPRPTLRTIEPGSEANFKAVA